MALVWAMLGLIWTWGATALALHYWRAPDRWKRDGRLDNGLGTVVIYDEADASWRFAKFQVRAFAAFGFLVAFGGFGLSLGWVWRAVVG